MIEAGWPYVLLLAVATVSATALYALFGVYLERKVSAFIQDRMGPMEVGPWGLLQTLADILKLVQKELIRPADTDPWLFRLAPLLIFVAIFAGFAAIPFAPGLWGSSASIGLLYILAVVSTDVVGLLMAGWGSNNKYALMGAVRSVAQIVSYEVPAGIALLATVMMYGSLNLQDITLQQGLGGSGPQYLFGVWDVSPYGGVLSWGALRYPHLLLAMVLYYIAGLAEANRAPFDMPEAESELVAGYHTEYSGFRFAIVMLAEYAAMLLVSAVLAVLFLGGWHTPVPNLAALPAGTDPATLGFGQLLAHGQLGYITGGIPGHWSATMLGLFWLAAKSFGLVLLTMWVRWTYPRLRPDQLMTLCWQYLTPAAFLVLFLSAVWKLAEVYLHLG